MKRNGFTLIELLITIAIIGILGVIAGGAIINSLGGAKEDINEVQRQMIITAAKTYVADNMDKCSSGCPVDVDTLIREGYIDEIDEDTKNQIGSIDVTYDTTTKQYTYEAVNKVFACEEKIVTYTIPTDGNYTIKAAGAEGTTGNNYNYSGTPPTGGKGASISSTFNLKKDDELTIVVGCQGSVAQATATDGTSGAGGGGSFVFKKIDLIEDNTYQFTKGSIKYETLLVAAGGGGSTDNAYKNNDATAGADGRGTPLIAPGGTTYSAQTIEKETSLSLSDVLSVKQFINYDLYGGYYERNNGKCMGGYGGGGCRDDFASCGGGWSKISDYPCVVSSFSSGSNTSGVTGAQSGNGYVKIYKN